MKKRFLILMFAVCLLPVASGAVSPEDEKAIVERSLEGQRLIFERRYDDALKVFDELDSSFPGSPAGSFGRMAVFEMRMLEREDFHLQAEYEKASAVGLAKVGNVLQMYSPSTWDLFLAGSVLGLDGFFKARKGKWWEAYVAGSKSRQLFKRVKEMDPSFGDADFGLGMYIYWRSVYARDLWFLRFLPDRRKEGIAIIERVARQGRFAGELARANLGIVYMEEGRFADAGRVFRGYVERFPQNVLLRKFLGKVLVVQKKYDEAVAQFKAALAVDPAVIVMRYFIGATLIMKGGADSYAEARAQLNEFLKVSKSPYWQGSAHYWLGRLNEIEKDKKGAIAEYQEAARLNPKLKDALARIRGLGAGV